MASLNRSRGPQDRDRTPTPGSRQRSLNFRRISDQIREGSPRIGRVAMDESTSRPTAASPSNSPRLPSPPPLPELQLGPRSPAVTGPSDMSLDSITAQDDGASRRIRPGSTAAEMARGPPFVPLHQLESPFQLQEYLKSLYSKVTRKEGAQTIEPITKETAMELATPPVQQDTGEPVDRNLWLYELCRFLVQRSNRLIVAFFNDSPPCSSQTCSEMRASEWQYLCAVHEPPKSCCAIDYCCHTLDWAGNVLTSSKHFPSRLSLGGEGGNAFQSMRQLTNIFRRVYRIYAHAWFQHREVFWSLEQTEGLYMFFKTVCDAYQLIPEDNYTIPPEAEGDREEAVAESQETASSSNIQILQNEHHQPTIQDVAEDATANMSTAATTRRHRHTPSTGTQVTMIAEGSEDDEDVTQIQDSETAVVPETSESTVDRATVQSTTESSVEELSTSQGLGRLQMPSQSADLRAPEDPTPTPEHYNTDPFEDTPTNLTSSNNNISYPTTSPPAYTINSASDDSKDKTPSTPPPSLNTKIPTPTLTSTSKSETITSPGGGSIRTVGPDILAGILEHVGDNDDNVEEVKKEHENDEEMGEISLSDVATEEKTTHGEEKEADEKTTSLTTESSS